MRSGAALRSSPRKSVRIKVVNVRSVRRSFRKSRAWIFEMNLLHVERCFEEQSWKKCAYQSGFDPRVRGAEFNIFEFGQLKKF
jgi:hypothetical protein